MQCTNSKLQKYFITHTHKKTQLESFISFIEQANNYCESEDQALCCGCGKYKAGADTGPVINEPQSNRKQKRQDK